MRIPNVDGEYATKDGKVKVTVSRKSIELDFERGSTVHIIDEQPPKGQPSDKMDNMVKVINKTCRMLTG